MNIKINWLSRNTKAIIRDVGLLLHLPGIMALVSLPICFIFSEYYTIPAFLLTALASLSIGQLLYQIGDYSSDTRLRHAMLVAAISWGVVPFLGAIPFLAIASHFATLPEASQTILNFQNPGNALFESFAGFSSAGLTMALHPSKLPHSLQWWRSLMQWIGGVGIIVLVIAVLEPSTDAYELYYAEGREKRIALTVTKTVRKIWKIYLFYTALSILLLRITGMRWWEAINHGLTGIATGGFAITDDSMSSYSIPMQLAMIIILILGSISFAIHYQLLTQRRLSVLWQDAQHRALWFLLVLGTILLLLENFWHSQSFLWLDSLFQWISALSTCGFSTVKLQNWSPTAKLLLSIAMIFGGAAGSTVGGLKLKRVAFLYKAILWRFSRLSLQPHELMRYKLENKVLTESEASRQIKGAAVLALLWISLLIFGVLILLHVVKPEYTLSDVIFEGASALGSVGLSIGISQPDLHWLGKLILILFMWMGRLEIVPVILLFSAIVSNIKSLRRQA
ncbi:MAG TPA: TrkH family potassium uptake protein [Oculatellaceae cyanobacterium]